MTVQPDSAGMRNCGYIYGLSAWTKGQKNRKNNKRKIDSDDIKFIYGIFHISQIPF